MHVELTTVKKSKFRGLVSLELENNLYLVKILPEAGGKIASLIYKPSGKEFLLQGKDEKCRLVDYDGDFLKADQSGIDDMFPTISEYHYEDYPWKGVRIPDHGEVWSLAWDYEIKNDQVALAVSGVRLPYKLKKRIELIHTNILRISYEAINPTDFDINYIWAAHIMIKADDGCRQIAPKDMIKAICTYSESGRMGNYGDVFDFPFVKQQDGTMYDASVYSEQSDDFQKFYFKDKMKKGLYGLKYPDGHLLEIMFPTDVTPYFSGLNAEGGSFGIRCVHLEPCSAPFDRPDIAKLHGKESVLKARSVMKWNYDIKIINER